MPRKDRTPFFVRVRGMANPKKADGWEMAGKTRTASVYFAMEGQAIAISARVSDNGSTEYRVDLVPHPAPSGRREGVSANLMKAVCGPNAEEAMAGIYDLPLPEGV